MGQAGGFWAEGLRTAGKVRGLCNLPMGGGNLAFNRQPPFGEGEPGVVERDQKGGGCRNTGVDCCGHVISPFWAFPHLWLDVTKHSLPCWVFRQIE